MKRVFVFGLILIILFACSACATEQEKPLELEPKVTQMRAICELAVMDCYYHDVAKVFEEDATGFLFWTKDKHFWVEYSGIVRLGVDISQVSVTVSGTKVTITLPPAKVLDCKVDSSSLNEESFIMAENSAEARAEDTVKALELAQIKMEETASNDKTLLASAQQRAQLLLEEYVNNIGETVGKTYTISWIYINENGSKTVVEPETNISETGASE